MRTTIAIDDGLMRAALRVTDLPTKRAVVEKALELLVLNGQGSIRELTGKVRWKGDLGASRRRRKP